MNTYLRNKKIVFIVILSAVFIMFCSASTFALTTEQVEQQVSEQGKEIATGNVLIWFLCALAFLKASQKIDSFMSSLGINVGRTGGSLIAEMMVAARGFTGVTGFSGSNGKLFGKNNQGESSHRPLEGGIAGTVGRMFTREAASSVTNQNTSVVSGIAKSAFEKSLENGGGFAEKVIGGIAKGEVAGNGTIKGSAAADAFRSYMGLGLNQADNKMTGGQENQVANITKQENSAFDTAKQTDSASEYNMPLQHNPIENTLDNKANQTEPIAQTNDIPLQQIPNGTTVSIQSENLSQAGTAFHNTAIETAGMAINNAGNENFLSQEAGKILNQNINSGTNNMQETGQGYESNTIKQLESSKIDSSGQIQEMGQATNGIQWLADTPMENKISNDANWLPDSPNISDSDSMIEGSTAVNMPVYEDSISANEDNASTPILNDGQTADMSLDQPTVFYNKDSLVDSSPASVAQSNTSGILKDSASVSRADNLNPEKLASTDAVFTNMEIGGGRITGIETSKNHPNGTKFAMYSAEKYAAPEDAYKVIKAVDGSKWYHQYAKK